MGLSSIPESTAMSLFAGILALVCAESLDGESLHGELARITCIKKPTQHKTYVRSLHRETASINLHKELAKKLGIEILVEVGKRGASKIAHSPPRVAVTPKPTVVVGQGFGLGFRLSLSRRGWDRPLRSFLPFRSRSGSCPFRFFASARMA